MDAGVKYTLGDCLGGFRGLVAGARGGLVPLHHLVAGGLVYGPRSRREMLIHGGTSFQALDGLDHPVFANLVNV